MLSIGIPLANLGLPFIISPSLSEAAYFILLFYLIINENIFNQRFRQSTFIFGIILFFYISIITINGAFQFEVKIEYPVWATFRIFQWIILIPLIVKVKKQVIIRSLAFGILLGAIINSMAAVLELFGYSLGSSIILNLNTTELGPWAQIIERDPYVHGATGLFSFSRTVSGVFMAITALFAIYCLKKDWLIFVSFLILSAGVLSTESRLGFFVLCFALINIARKMGVFIALLTLILLLIMLDAIFNLHTIYLDSFLRIFKIFDTGLLVQMEDRFDSQILIFDIAPMWLLFGVGVGNLGHALNLYQYPLYGAHGFIYQYLASIGVIGSIILVFYIYLISNSVFKFWSFYTLPLFFLFGISEDFFFPTAEGMHISVIFFILLKFFFSEVIPSKNTNPHR